MLIPEEYDDIDWLAEEDYEYDYDGIEDDFAYEYFDDWEEI